MLVPMGFLRNGFWLIDRHFVRCAFWKQSLDSRAYVGQDNKKAPAGAFPKRAMKG
jgi:hypothetical protein